MAAPRASGLAGAALAVAALGAVLLAPRTLADAERALALAPADPGPAECRVEPACDPRLADAVERVDAALEARLRALSLEDRLRLAGTIVVEAERARIDPLLVLALIQVESSFDPAAASHRGARGLMQLRPSTMAREAQRSGIAFEDPHDPVANVQAGVRYLRRLLDAFGREEVALMAYNAGPNRILGYLREGGIPERFHAYPRRVKRELRKLRRSMGGEASPAVAVAARPGAHGRRPPRVPDASEPPKVD